MLECLNKMDEEKPIIIAGKNVREYLFVIGKRGLTANRIRLHVADKYMATAEYLLGLLRRSFGWEEIDRGKVEGMNFRCVYDSLKISICPKCKNQKRTKKCSCPDFDVPGGCTEDQRQKPCPHYKSLYNSTIWVNEIIIEKLPQLWR